MFFYNLCSNTTISEQEFYNIDLINEINELKKKLDQYQFDYLSIEKQYKELYIQYKNIQKDLDQYMAHSEHKYTKLFNQFSKLKNINSTLQSFLTEGEQSVYKNMIKQNTQNTEKYFNKYQKNKTETEEILLYRLNKIESLEKENQEQSQLILKLQKENFALKKISEQENNQINQRKNSNKSDSSSKQKQQILLIKKSISNGSKKISNNENANLDIHINSQKDQLSLSRSQNNTPDLMGEIIPLSRNISLGNQNYNSNNTLQQINSQIYKENDIS